MSGLLPALGGGGGSGGLPGLLTTHAMQLVAGGLSGLVAMSAAIATGVVPTGQSSDGPLTLALVGCPGSGSIVAVARPGDEMLVTGRSADGSWLRVYVPGPVAKDGWVPASSLELLADGSALPVAACIQVAGATGVPGPSATSVAATASAGPTATAIVKATAKPTAAPTPTATAQVPSPTTGSTAALPPTLAPTPKPNVGPLFTSGPTSSAATMYADPSGDGDCWGLPRRITITVKVSDPNGISGVQLFVRKPGATAYAMLHNFSYRTTYWNTYIDAAYDRIRAGGTMSFYAIATDGAGLKTQSKTGSVAVRQCDTDAAVTVSIDVPFSDGMYKIQGNCVTGPVPWYFTIRDPDGSVASAVLSLTKTNYIGTANQTVTLWRLIRFDYPEYWYGESTTLDGETRTDWVMTATDVNGGTTINTGTVVIRSVCIK
jgi:hypothetical protein